MPDVTFTRDSADADATITGLGQGVWVLNCPASPETITTLTTTAVNFHTSITVPVGYTVYLLPYNNTFIAGAAACFVVAGSYQGTGNPIALHANCINRSGSSQTPTAGQPIAKIVVIATEFKTSTTAYTP